MPKISACVISYNEEQNIGDCLRSLEGVADEIVVVDSFSTDRTVEIASQYTDCIYHEEFVGYIEKKNLAVSKATYDWILSLDCDERLSVELKSSILEIKQHLDEKQNAYRMPRKTFYVYRWLNHCWYPDKKVRLFNKNNAHWGGINPHDKVIVEQGSIIDLRGDLHHYSFNSISDHLQTIDKLSEIGAREIIAGGKTVSLLTPFTHGIWTFTRLYFIKRGFLDGLAGIIVSVLSFMHTYVKYNKVLIHQRMSEKSTRNE
jgi:glycosyltransferase involved in cell wall biosynthesis